MLFNGGALTPTAVARRACSRSWAAGLRRRTAPGWRPRELSNPRPELAVAIGAAYYGLVRMGAGVRIGSGSPRAYYVGVRGQEDDDVDLADGGNDRARCLSGASWGAGRV